MKRIIKGLTLILLTFVLSVPVSAQLFNQYKSEVVGVSYMQFPIQKERKHKMTYEVVEANLLGKMAKKVIKNDKITGALTAKGGLLGDSHSEEFKPKILIPEVFPTNGDLHLEINYSTEFLSKGSMDTKRVFHRYVKGGELAKSLTSFKVYLMPGKKLIYTQKPVWVESYVKKSGSKSSSGPGAMSAPLMGAELDGVKRTIAKQWALEQAKDLYGINYKWINIPVYTIKGLESEQKSKCNDIQEKFVSLLSKFNGGKVTPEYEKEVNECVVFWNKLLKQYKPGTTKKKQSVINDKNAWCLYFNISSAYVVLNEKSKAKKYLSKALALKKVKVKEIFNKKGEKKGEVKTMFSPLEQSYLSEMESMQKNYFKGRESQKPVFVELVTNPQKKGQASRFAKAWATNLYLSTTMNLDVPVSFTSKFTKGSPKLITGSVDNNGNSINYTVKKSPIYFLTKKYTAKIATADNSIRTKMKLNADLIPFGTKSVIYGLTAKMNHYVVKNADKTRWCSTTKVQYDYNGDILLDNNMLKDKFWFQKFGLVGANDALMVNQKNIRLKHNNYDLKSINETITNIVHERNIGFFSAFIGKILVPNEPLAVLSTDKKSSKETLSYSGNKLKIKRNGKTSNEKLSYKNDDNGNWIEYKAGNIVVNRNLVY